MRCNQGLEAFSSYPAVAINPFHKDILEHAGSSVIQIPTSAHRGSSSYGTLQGPGRKASRLGAGSEGKWEHTNQLRFHGNVGPETVSGESENQSIMGTLPPSSYWKFNQIFKTYFEGQISRPGGMYPAFWKEYKFFKGRSL